MKIAYLLGSLNRGGTETLMLDVFKNASINNLNAIGIYRKSGVLENEFLKSEVEMYHLPTGKNIFLYLFRLRKLLQSQKTEIVHAQQPIDAFLSLIACLFTDTRVILTLHAYDFTETNLSKTILKSILKRTYLNIYVSDSQKIYYTQKYKLNTDKQKTVYNGIEFEKFNISENSTIRKDLKIESGSLLLGTVGNFVPGRDQITICKFLNKLNNQSVTFQFVFIGKKNEQTPERFDACVNYIKDHKLSDRVHFWGSRQDVPEILQQLDAFIYSTEHDTFGIAVVEAMASGIPVFVNDWDVMTEITENGNLARLYKTKDEIDLNRQFSLFLQNKEEFKAKAKKAAIEVKIKYSIEKHIEELKKTYDR